MNRINFTFGTMLSSLTVRVSFCAINMKWLPLTMNQCCRQLRHRVSWILLNPICIPRNVEIFPQLHFAGFRLESINFGSESRLRQIEDSCFANYSLKSISIPRNIVTLRKWWLLGCTQLELVAFEGESWLIRIEELCFPNCPGNLIYILRYVEILPKTCFSGSGTESITFERDLRLKLIEKPCISRTSDFFFSNMPVNSRMNYEHPFVHFGLVNSNQKSEVDGQLFLWFEIHFVVTLIMRTSIPMQCHNKALRFSVLCVMNTLENQIDRGSSSSISGERTWESNISELTWSSPLGPTQPQRPRLQDARNAVNKVIFHARTNRDLEDCYSVCVSSLSISFKTSIRKCMNYCSQLRSCSRLSENDSCKRVRL
jgi:hypothetical protein